MKTLLIDGDILVYRAGFAVEKVFEFEPGQWASTADFNEAQQKLDKDIEDMLETLKADEAIVCLSDALNWRKDLYPNYKLQRTKTRKPMLIGPLKEYINETYKTFTRPTLEADDVLGILAGSTKIGGDKIICTIDKDLLQIPGKHWHMVNRTKRTVKIEDGDRMHLLQSLTGDVVDNYPGCPGIGPKSADKLLGTKTGMEAWRAISDAFEKKGLTEEDALMQAQIARICRSSDYDFKNKQVKLWRPDHANG